MKSKLQQAINSIENLLQDGTIYYSTEENSYFIGFHGGLGNFELFQLPKAWTGLFISQDVEPASLSAAVTGNLKLDGQTSDVVEDQIVQISKVRNAELYGQIHDGNLTSALLFASKHHQHQIRKASDEPYINHLLEVLQLLVHFEPDCDESTRIAAVLHDIVEDTTAPIESVEFLFGDDVANLVAQLTCTNAKDSEDKKTKLFQQISIANPRAKQIKLADIISNVTSLPESWSVERKESYVKWCKNIASECAISSPNLYEQFSYVIQINAPIETALVQQDVLLSIQNITAENLFNAEFDPDNEKFSDVIKLALEYFKTPEDAKRWFNTTNRGLGNITPLTLIETDIGLQRVENCIIELIHGMTC